MILSIHTIGVVIVTYRRSKQLYQTIDAVLDQGIAPRQIWVINNDKNDQLEFLQTEEKFQAINLQTNAENIASAGGFALGMKLVLESGLAWAWLFNDDSRPVNGSLKSLLNHRDELQKVNTGMVKLANLNSKGEAILQFWNGSRKPTYVPVSEDLVETDLITFDGCLLSTEMIKEIGTCDPAYFMGTYEFDFCLRARDFGYKIYTIPNGLIEDEKAGSIGGTPPWRQYYNTRNHLHLGINRKDPTIIWAWVVREAKFTYAILRFQDQKVERLRFKILASWHALINKRGKVLDPKKQRDFL